MAKDSRPHQRFILYEVETTLARDGEVTLSCLSSLVLLSLFSMLECLYLFL